MVEDEGTSTNQVIRSELNIERFPLFTTSQFKGKSREYTREERLPSGDVQQKRVVIGKIADNEVGVFRILDLKCFYTLVKLWENAGRPVDQDVSFSIHRISKILGKVWSGRSYKQVKDSLERLRKIPIDWIHAFYCKDRDETHELLETFTILAVLKLYEKRGKKQRVMEALSCFRFNESIIANLLNNYSKPIWLDVVLNLHKEISILLYLHIDLVMAKRTDYARRLDNLILEDLDLGGSYPYPSYRRRVIEPALKELKGIRLSTGTLTSAELEKTQDGADWKVVFKKTPFVESLPPPDAPEVMSFVTDILQVTGDVYSRPFYTQLARKAVANPKLFDLIYRCLSEVKQDAREGKILTNEGAAFTDRLKRYCQERGIDLGLRPSAN